MKPTKAVPCEGIDIERGFLPRQRGFSVILLLLLIGVVAGASILSLYKPGTQAAENEKKTAEALARAKEALIGYAASRGGVTDTARPGELPCPDTKLSTDPNYGTEDPTCVAGAIGRLPWKTLGIPEPKDSAGESLWYAVAGPFRRNPPNAGIINSDTRGSMVVFAADGETLLTNEAVAVIFAPGLAVGSQTRGLTTTALCATTATALAHQLCAANYLDAMANRNNATINGPFIAGNPSTSNSTNYNDRVMVMTAADVMPAVEMRVARELKGLLEGYRANSKCKCYPWAADFAKDLVAAALPNAESKSSRGRNRGRVPLSNARPKKWSAAGTVPPPGSIPAFPLWFGYNNWQNVIYYSVARQNTNGGGFKCKTCSIEPMLNVNGEGVSVLFFTSGTPVAGITRPSNNLADYLEDGQNSDGSNDVYVLPTATGRNRDRITTMIAAASLPADAYHDDGDDD